MYSPKMVIAGIHTNTKNLENSKANKDFLLAMAEVMGTLCVDICIATSLCQLFVQKTFVFVANSDRYSFPDQMCCHAQISGGSGFKS